MLKDSCKYKQWSKIMPKNKMNYYSKVMCLIFTVFLGSCASVHEITEKSINKAGEMFLPKDGRFDFSLEGETVVYIDAKSYLSDIIVNVAANRHLEQKPSALFMPFGLTQDHHDHAAISNGVSRIIWQQFLGEETFSVLEFSQTKPPYMVENVIPGARALGADFLVGGYITYYFDGAGVGDSKIAILLEVYDTNTGALLWSLNQSGIFPYKFEQKNVFFTIDNRMPMSPISSLVAAIGSDLAKFLHHWTDQKGMQDKEARQGSGSGILAPSAFGKY